jgi:hypothetical protein
VLAIRLQLSIHILDVAWQETPQAEGFLDLHVHRLLDRLLLRRSPQLALEADRGSLRASELTGHAGSGNAVPGHLTPYGGAR